MPPGIIGPNGGLYNSSSSVQVSENTTFVFDFDSNEAVTWGISGGQDLLRFSINSSTGALAFNSAPDYENPSDYPDGGAPNNNYVVTISATSSSGSTSYHTVVVQVQDVNESGAGTGSAGSSGSRSSGSGSSGSGSSGSGSSGSGSPPPGIIGPDGGLYNSSSTIQASENTTTVFDFNSNQEVAWAVSGGQDGHLFSIASSTGVLSFKNAPDYENPTDYPDSGASDNNYVVTISATNSSGSVSYHTIAVQVQNVTDSSDGSSGSSGSGSGSSGSIPPVTDVSPTTTPVTPTPTQESPVLGIQPQETVTTVELSTPIVLGNLEVTKAVVGTDSRDVVTGSDEGEALAGGKGKDQMTGGGGSDAFVFETPGEFGRQSADVITDLNSDQGDKIVIASDAFKGVSKIKFTSVTGKGNAKDAASSNKTFVYDDKTGMLYFNENGRKDGFGDGGEFVKLVGAPELGKSDIVII